MTSIDTQHTDLIHDGQMDFFGKRVATCSSDRTIRIFNVSEDSMTLATELKGHEGPVWQVSWAHPNFGSVLASCSFDRKVIIWKEEGGNWTIWHEFPFNRSVNTVAWAPVDLGLVIACGSSDGTISILSFSESAGWSKIKTLKAHEPGVNAVSWAPYQIGGPCRLVSGGSDNTVKIWTRKTEDGIEWDVETLSGHGHWVRDVAWAPNIGLPYSTIASSSQEGKVKIWTKLNNERVWTSVDLPLEGNEPVWRVSWSITGNILAVSSGDNRVSLWKESLEEKNDNKPVWRSISRLDENGDLIVADDEN